MDGIRGIARPDLNALAQETRSKKLTSEVRHSTPEIAGRKMEALFATMLVKELRQALPQKGFFGEGPGADTYNAWLDQFLGEVLAERGALNLTGRVEGALERSSAAETREGVQ